MHRALIEGGVRDVFSKRVGKLVCVGKTSELSATTRKKQFQKTKRREKVY